MRFYKENKKFFLFGVFPFILVVVILFAYSSAAEKNQISSGEAVNIKMQSANLDSTELSKADAYDSKKVDDEFKSNQDADLSFNLLPEDNQPASNNEPSLEIKAIIEAQNKLLQEQELAKNKREHDDYQRRINQQDDMIIKSYQPKASRSEPQQTSQELKRQFNSLKVNNEGAAGKNSFDDGNTKSVQAVVFKDTKISNNSNIVFRLIDTVTVDGVKLGRNTVLNGIASFSGQRINVKLAGSNIQGMAIEYSFTVFDSDGEQGLRIDENSNKDLARNSYQSEIDRISSTAGSQLGTVGRVGGSIISGITRSRNPKVKIPAGYKVILKQKY